MISLKYTKTKLFFGIIIYIQGCQEPFLDTNIFLVFGKQKIKIYPVCVLSRFGFGIYQLGHSKKIIYLTKSNLQNYT